ncbi:hypothetical protein DRH27_02335 [Candidatus Falkowbacteria bacterium]|nr:MAG: hypothetical protein DRH27_02335 [Candidatus Falkowbacteria bacterium]
MQNFWKKLIKPTYVLAPMAGVADSAFRQVCKSYGADVVYSEMASATALVYNPKKTLQMLVSDKKEQPYVVQLFGGEPKHFAVAAKLITVKGVPRNSNGILRFAQNDTLIPNGIDINFGCPVKKVQKQGAGAVLMNDLKKSREIIKAVINNTELPVSIKTRSRVGQVGLLEFLDNIKDLDIKALMIHGRSMKQGFSGSIDTRIIREARNYFGGIILANGGIYSYSDSIEMLEKTEADGVGIAHGALGRPWIFKAVRTGQSVNRSKKAIFKVAIKHAELACKLKGEQGIIEMRKHLCWYVRGLPGAAGLRQDLVKVESLDDIRDILRKNI